MGIYKFIETFELEDVNVEKTKDHISIGNGYVHDFITVYFDGTIRASDIISEDGPWGDKLKKLKEISKVELFKIVFSEDFLHTAMHAVYYEKNGKLCKTYCKTPGYPNTTIEGDLMYENTHFSSKKEAEKRMIEEAAAGVRLFLRYRFKEGVISFGKLLFQLLQVTSIYIRAKVFRGIL